MDSIAAIYASDGAARSAKTKASGVGERRRGDRISANFAALLRSLLAQSGMPVVSLNVRFRG
jgi:hypothetical protein